MSSPQTTSSPSSSRLGPPPIANPSAGTKSLKRKRPSLHSQQQQQQQRQRQRIVASSSDFEADDHGPASTSAASSTAQLQRPPHQPSSHRPTSRTAAPRSPPSLPSSRTPSPRKATRSTRTPHRPAPRLEMNNGDDRDATLDRGSDGGNKQDINHTMDRRRANRDRSDDDGGGDDDADGDDDDDGEFELDDEAPPSQASARARRTPSRIGAVRSRRARVSVMIADDDDVDEEHDAIECNRRRGSSPRKSNRRPRRTASRKLLSEDDEGTEDDDAQGGDDDDRVAGRAAGISPTAAGSTTAKEEDEVQEEEMDEEAKRAAQAKREEDELVTRWTEEYFEIVEQLPLEIHRSLALLRELESQMTARLASVSHDAIAYRDARLALHQNLLNKTVPADPNGRAQTVPPSHAGSAASEPATVEAQVTTQAKHATKNPPDGGTNGNGSSSAAAPEVGSDEAQKSGPAADVPPASLQGAALPPSSTAPASPTAPEPTLSSESRKSLLHRISQCACEAVRAGEEKVGLAITTYEWIDRQCRRLDADLKKIESSLVLGLRTGTEESRGLREAQGLATDGGTREGSEAEEEAGQEAGEGMGSPAEEGPVDDAEVAAVKSNTVTPRLGGDAVLLAEEAAADGGLTRKRARRSSGAAGAPSIPHGEPAASAVEESVTRTRAGGRRRTVSQASATKLSDRAVSPTAASTQAKPKGRQAALPETTSIVPGHEAMAIDPNEPRYCYCDQPSFDEMVACDNDDCPREWFHYGCVGLTASPKGKWYCRFCAPPNWKGPGTDVPPGARFRPHGYKSKKRKG
ncbi:uncharacterized protein PFL1_06531 [Pseudozyma flocculosa PF-1]|uniref:Chromatin modification-related protein n=1 Tax=Pseudozyma flocculosa PF-1 TaxID=1277687 RepID=A0A061H5H8_9BASI|nr:uncharacterized protein PFL1_06531 [Pseudozyma flocculosa PF-1]EPQ25856.1 hypothetical protein PFL1_06531 [Pseudozyma flocculosa PF-1]